MAQTAKRWKIVALAAAAVLAALGAWEIGGYRRAAERLAEGRALYAMHCAACHGAGLEGQPNWQTPMPNGRMPAPPHNASGHTWHHGDRELRTIITSGLSAVIPGYASDMPAFGAALNGEEVNKVLDYIKSTWPARERDYQRDRTRAERGPSEPEPQP